MDEKQALLVQAPPPYTEQQGYPPQPQPQQQQGYQQSAGIPGYPHQGYPPPAGYPPQGQPGYPPQGYPPQGYPPPAQPYQPPPQQVIAPVQTVTTNVIVQNNAPPEKVVSVVAYPPDHCALAWFACLCCFWPIGICAIISASQTRDAIDRGDLAAATHSSMMARKYATCAIVFGIVAIVVIIIVNITAQ